MRSALILASLALSALAAPVAVNEGQAPVRRRDLPESAAPAEFLMTKRYQRMSDGSLVDSRDVHINARSEQEEDEMEKRASRYPTKRSVDDEEEEVEEEVEKRASRYHSKRASRYPTKRNAEEDEIEEEVEKRASRYPTKRNAEEDEVEKRASRYPTKRNAEDEVEKRASRYPTKRTTEAPKNTVRNIYDGVVGIVEALKTRGFSSASNLPVKQPM